MAWTFLAITVVYPFLDPETAIRFLQPAINYHAGPAGGGGRGLSFQGSHLSQGSGVRQCAVSPRETDPSRVRLARSDGRRMGSKTGGTRPYPRSQRLSCGAEVRAGWVADRLLQKHGSVDGAGSSASPEMLRQTGSGKAAPRPCLLGSCPEPAGCQPFPVLQAGPPLSSLRSVPGTSGGTRCTLGGGVHGVMTAPSATEFLVSLEPSFTGGETESKMEEISPRLSFTEAPRPHCRLNRNPCSPATS